MVYQRSPLGHTALWDALYSTPSCRTNANERWRQEQKSREASAANHSAAIQSVTTSYSNQSTSALSQHNICFVTVAQNLCVHFRYRAGSDIGKQTAACLLTSSTTTTSTTGCSPHCVLDVFTGLLFVRILLRSSEYMIACGIRSYEIEKLVLQIEKLRLPWNATHHGFHVIWD